MITLLLQYQGAKYTAIRYCLDHASNAVKNLAREAVRREATPTTAAGVAFVAMANEFAAALAAAGRPKPAGSVTPCRIRAPGSKPGAEILLIISNN